MPPDHRLRLHDEQHVPPTTDESAQEDPEHPVSVFEASALDASLQDQDLLVKDCIPNREPVSI